ncbi:DNA-directed RNA polymerase subunit beta'' [Dirofilaria immitis]
MCFKMTNERISKDLEEEDTTSGSLTVQQHSDSSLDAIVQSASKNGARKINSVNAIFMGSYLESFWKLELKKEGENVRIDEEIELNVG